MANPLNTPNPGFTLHVKVQVDPSNIDRFIQALRPCRIAVYNEPKCMFFEVFHSQAEPGTFRFVEVWAKDMKWFEEHQLTKDYLKSYLKIVEPMISRLEREVLDRLQTWNFVDERYLAGSVKAKEDVNQVITQSGEEL